MSEWISVEDRMPTEGIVALYHAPSRTVCVGPNQGVFVTPTTVTVRCGPQEWQIHEATH